VLFSGKGGRGVWEGEWERVFYVCRSLEGWEMVGERLLMGWLVLYGIEGAVWGWERLGLGCGFERERVCGWKLRWKMGDDVGFLEGMRAVYVV